MSWYLVLGLSLLWIAGLYVYAYFADGESTLGTSFEVMLVIGYVVLYASWPTIILCLGLITAEWYAWVALGIEAFCLIFSPVIWAERLHESYLPAEEGVIERALSPIVGAFILVVGPLALALPYITFD